jgi:hypothetical protein
MLRRVVWYKFTDISEVVSASIIIALMMEAASISETSVNFYQTTRRNISVDSDLVSHVFCAIFIIHLISFYVHLLQIQIYCRTDAI